MAALISSVMETRDKVPVFIDQAEEMGITILPPDVNTSGQRFTVEGRSIRIGLGAIRGIGRREVDAILEDRAQHGPFPELAELRRRLGFGLSAGGARSLVGAGGLDGTGRPRDAMLAIVDGEDISPTHIALLEHRALGCFVSRHLHLVLDRLDELRELADCSISEALVAERGTQVAVVGILAETFPPDEVRPARLVDREASIDLEIDPLARTGQRTNFELGALLLASGHISSFARPGPALIVDTLTVIS
jgi:Helix-hairpin-helix motif